MVPRTQLYSSFIQYGATCILTSYAIVSKYYTSISILNFFKDYCRHFDIETEEKKFAEYFRNHFRTRNLNQTERVATWIKLSELNKYEIAYDNHFHQEDRFRKIGGLKLMKEIHESSHQNSFKISKNAFNLTFIEHILNDYDNVYHHLKHQESLIIVAFNGEESGRHIAVVGYDKNGLYMVETRSSKNSGTIGISSLSSLPNPGDALLATRKNDRPLRPER